MKWVLVYLFFADGQMNLEEDEQKYNTMIECFNARENKLVEVEGFDGYFPVNTQAICVRIE